MGSDNLFLRKMNAAKAGIATTIGFIGGSITQGTGASVEENCYAYRAYKWWATVFSDTEITYINAGIGGTDSKFGVARVDDDLLRYKPDVVIVEFAVNDVDNPDCLETAEGLIRKILKSSPDVAILILCNLIYDSGATMQEEYFRLADYYGLPCISIKDTIYADIKGGKILQSDVTADNIHPLDFGHELIANEIIKYFDGIKDKLLPDSLAEKRTACAEIPRPLTANTLEKRTASSEIPSPLTDNAIEKSTASSEIPRPLTANTYENVVRINNTGSNATKINDTGVNIVCKGFVVDKSEQEDIRDCFKKGWYAGRPGDRIDFNMNSKGFVVQYRRTVKGPAPKVKVLVDEKEVATLDGKFDQDWGDKLEIVTVAEYDRTEEHRLTLVVDEAEDNCVPFYLVSVIAKR